VPQITSPTAVDIDNPDAVNPPVGDAHIITIEPSPSVPPRSEAVGSGLTAEAVAAAPAACAGTDDGTGSPAACTGADDGSGTDEACAADAVTDPVTDCAFTAGDAATCGVGCTYQAAAAGAACALSGDASGCAVVGGDCAYTPVIAGASCVLSDDASACAWTGGDCVYTAAIDEVAGLAAGDEQVPQLTLPVFFDMLCDIIAS
jgi:hypothetical protein